MGDEKIWCSGCRTEFTDEYFSRNHRTDLMFKNCDACRAKKRRHYRKSQDAKIAKAEAKEREIAIPEVVHEDLFAEKVEEVAKGIEEFKMVEDPANGAVDDIVNNQAITIFVRRLCTKYFGDEGGAEGPMGIHARSIFAYDAKETISTRMSEDGSLFYETIENINFKDIFTSTVLRVCIA